MWYDYRCPECGHVETAQRAIADRNDPPTCSSREHPNNNTRMRRIPSVPQLITQRTVDMPENRIGGVGFGDKYRLDVIKEHEKERMERSKTYTEKVTPKKLDDAPSLLPFAQQAGVL